MKVKDKQVMLQYVELEKCIKECVSETGKRKMCKCSQLKWGNECNVQL